MKMSARPQNSTLTGSRNKRLSGGNAGWFAVQGTETCLPSRRVCRALFIGPTSHQALDGFPRAFNGAELDFSVNHQLHCAIPDIVFHELLPWLIQWSARQVVPEEVCSQVFDQKRSAA